jgi:hypothetical protein
MYDAFRIANIKISDQLHGVDLVIIDLERQIVQVTCRP